MGRWRIQAPRAFFNFYLLVGQTVLDDSTGRSHFTNLW